MNRREWLIAFLASPFVAHATELTAAELERYRTAVRRGHTFLARLFDPRMQLLPEYSGSSVYWLYHDNYLAAKLLRSSHPEIAHQIEAAIHRYGIAESGKIEILFDEARTPLPFRHPRLIEVQRIEERVIKTEVLTDQQMQGWEGYADLLLFAARAQAESNPPESLRRLREALRMWDGQGFRDQATEQLQRYATFKLALALVTTRRCGRMAELPAAILDRLLSLQADDGGWVTDYNSTGAAVGKTNVETTSMALLALEPLSVAHDSEKEEESP